MANGHNIFVEKSIYHGFAKRYSQKKYFRMVEKVCTCHGVVKKQVCTCPAAVNSLLNASEPRPYCRKRAAHCGSCLRASFMSGPHRASARRALCKVRRSGYAQVDVTGAVTPDQRDWGWRVVSWRHRGPARTGHVMCDITGVVQSSPTPRLPPDD